MLAGDGRSAVDSRGDRSPWHPSCLALGRSSSSILRSTIRHLQSTDTHCSPESRLSSCPPRHTFNAFVCLPFGTPSRACFHGDRPTLHNDSCRAGIANHAVETPLSITEPLSSLVIEEARGCWWDKLILIPSSLRPHRIGRPYKYGAHEHGRRSGCHRIDPCREEARALHTLAFLA